MVLPLVAALPALMGVSTLGAIIDFFNVFDAPKKTSMPNIAINLCLCMCCAFIAKNIISVPFKTPPIIVCLAVACLCSSVASKNLYDEGVARFPQAAEPKSK